MGIKFFKANLLNVAKSINFRLDFRYLNYSNKRISSNKIPFSNFILDIGNGKDISPNNYEDYDSSNVIYPTVNNFKKGEFVYDNVTFISDSYGLPKILEDNDIIISRSGTVGLTYVWNKKEVNEIFGRDIEAIPSGYLIVVKVDKNKLLPHFIKLLFNSVGYREYFNVFGVGKTQKNIAQPDILSIPIPNIDIKLQRNILTQIQPIETEITNLKNSKLKPLDIINQVFGEEFNISLEKIKELDNTKKLTVKLSSLAVDNSNLRSGLRWSKMQFIQKELYKNIDCIKLLGSYLITTKNGWSPLSVENGDGLPILGQESFSTDGVLKITPSKFTEETKNNISDFFINQGDFFVSRGNTVDLVALACVVEDEIDTDIIFPDLYIKLVFDESEINKQYLALVFNSFIGRLYFKYVAKGKNQTMVKISATELNNFHLPIPDTDKQIEIVEKVKSQIDAQKIIDDQIEAKQSEINKIIETAIQSE